MSGQEPYPSEEPPMSRPIRRRRPRAPALKVIIGLNIAVFIAWQAAAFFALDLAEANPRLLAFMVENFLVSTAHLVHGHLWTLVTAAFSHKDFLHLAINMFVLWSFGTVLEHLWGTRSFVVFYLIAAVVASISHCAVSSLLMGNGEIPALGASGAVSGLLMAYALHFPRHKILLFGIIPVPALAGVLGFVGIDLWGLLAQTRGGGLPIGHGAHLGGALAGALVYFFYFRERYRISDPQPVASPTLQALDPAEAREFERIRIKVESMGPQSLNPSELDFLERIRARVLERQT